MEELLQAAAVMLVMVAAMVGIMAAMVVLVLVGILVLVAVVAVLQAQVAEVLQAVHTLLHMAMPVAAAQVRLDRVLRALLAATWVVVVGQAVSRDEVLKTLTLVADLQ